jgi:hypothetical protein
MTAVVAVGWHTWNVGIIGGATSGHKDGFRPSTRFSGGTSVVFCGTDDSTKICKPGSCPVVKVTSEVLVFQRNHVVHSPE